MSQANLLLSPPLPLVSAKKKYIIIWTPKVASNIVLTWYMRDIGLLYAANFYSDRLHEFRGNVLVNSLYYKKWVEWAWADLNSYKIVKVMRDPFKRAVSSYRHVLRYPEQRAVIAKFSRQDLSNGFSFRQFLNALAKADIRNTDIHLRQQHHPLQDFVGKEKVDVILLDVIGDGLLKILDAKLGAMGTEEPFESEEEMRERVAANIKHYTETHHANYSGDSFGADSYADEVFTLEDHKEFPAFEKFLTPETGALVRQIYAADYADMDYILQKT